MNSQRRYDYAEIKCIFMLHAFFAKIYILPNPGMQKIQFQCNFHWALTVIIKKTLNHDFQ